jgi:hypothetical protein
MNLGFAVGSVQGGNSVEADFTMAAIDRNTSERFCQLAAYQNIEVVCGLRVTVIMRDFSK